MRRVMATNVPLSTHGVLTENILFFLFAIFYLFMNSCIFKVKKWDEQYTDKTRIIANHTAPSPTTTTIKTVIVMMIIIWRCRRKEEEIYEKSIAHYVIKPWKMITFQDINFCSFLLIILTSVMFLRAVPSIHCPQRLSKIARVIVKVKQMK